jgi:hypothetical protein
MSKTAMDNVRELTAEEERFRTVLLMTTVRGAKHFCQTTSSRVQQDAPFHAFESDMMADGLRAKEREAFKGLCQMLGNSWYSDTKYASTFEEEVRSKGEADDARRVSDVTAPKVVARSALPTPYMCYCCGKHAGTELQTPSDVYAVGYRLGGHVTALRCVMEMAQLLEAENFEEVTRRTACCRMVSCMLAQNRLEFDHYEGWLWTKDPKTGLRRPQLEKGTDRKGQGLELGDNLILLHCLAVQDPPVLPRSQLEALFRWVIYHSQFIQEREKRFIATAMAVADNPEKFGYRFSDAQSFVNRMAAFPRNYAHRIIFPHLMRKDLTVYKWRSSVIKILETAMPKPYDVIYAIMCEDNWHHQGRPVDSAGRPVHRVTKGAKHAKVFNACHFKKGLRAAVAVKKKEGYDLYFQDASSTDTSSAVADGPREHRELNQLVSGSRKGGKTKGFGTADFPTCGSRQKTSGAHPAERYASVFEAQGGYTAKEADSMVSLFMDKYEDGNQVGFELQKPKEPGSLSKACAVLRPVQIYEPPQGTTCLRRAQDVAMKALCRRPIGMGGGGGSIAKRPKVHARN